MYRVQTGGGAGGAADLLPFAQGAGASYVTDGDGAKPATGVSVPAGARTELPDLLADGFMFTSPW